MKRKYGMRREKVVWKCRGRVLEETDDSILEGRVLLIYYYNVMK